MGGGLLSAAALLLTYSAIAQPAAAPYLAPAAYADIQLSPPPPLGSPEAAAERQAWLRSVDQADTDRWRRAAADDAAFTGPSPALLFADALGFSRDAQAAPALNALLRRSLLDVEAAAAPLKRRFARPRPFEGDIRARLCIIVPPERRTGTATAYPSSSAALGVVWAGALAIVAPARRAELEARGHQIGELRLTCRVHYASDVTAGRQLGAAVLQRLVNDRAFRQDLARARAELAPPP